MTSPVLSIRGLSKRFGAHVVSDDINLELIEGEIHAVIGPNGAGKTTLMNQLIGELDSDAGTIIFEGRDITRLPTYERSLLGLSRSYQITSLFLDFTALENVSIAAQAHDGHSFGVWHPASREEGLTAASLESLQTVGLQDKANSLVSRSKVLLLDEPMAGMGTQESDMIVNLLFSLKGKYTILLVEHDMDAVFALADRISVLVYGKIIASGTPEAIRLSAEVRRAYLGESYASG
jgi:branched-chain amino acid transport system ATP-binding protein